ncbi:acyclic terpene utilization AtuA family protein [Actinocorallia sp. A-T 12471]|uniref:acyclic terpene utilization AtuA family protein n=1 Tax=Actinocorallia sp. A-T 12471 TaxID=3089813 RepID=UPI0029D1E4A9|nr:acyclic terpene utilization AtuA family protein [Actinocorallia sp. A-T 12471]MDX6740656.1 acyclic terpene utilization AtuA family protein [Actinocorallia sp. A-T 12471]
MELRLLAPTGALGAGFDTAGFDRGEALRPHVIACDAGSTDSGPSALGSGRPKLSDAAVIRDLRHLLRARAALGVPLVIGSAGTSGRDDAVDHLAALVRKLCRADGQRVRLGLAYADQPAERLTRLWDEGRIRALPHAPAVTRETFSSSHVVGMMGVEPLGELLEDGCDVIVAGRASDTALFAALPHLRGADPGLTWHAAKTIECGAACAVPPSANGLLATVRDDHFDVTVLHPGARLTARSVAAHTLYENADPFRVIEPSGVLDTTDASYESVDEQTVRVRGARFERAAEYTVKLEGARLAGYQTVIVGGVRDRVVIRRLPELIELAQGYFAAKIHDVFDGRVDPADVDIDFRLYGAGAVLGAHEPDKLDPDELGVLITVTAPAQETARAVATFVAHAASHLPMPEYDGLVTTIAYPFSPPETDRGPVYEFTLNHVATGITPTELFRSSVENV